jgi:hypothetical protein
MVMVMINVIDMEDFSMFPGKWDGDSDSHGDCDSHGDSNHGDGDDKFHWFGRF